MKGAEDLVELARTFGRIVERIAERETQGGDDDDDWVDQSRSDLQPRLHCAAVRRRLEEGLGGATIKHRRHLLTRAALREEMMRSPKPGLRKTTGKAPQPGPSRDTTSDTPAARAVARLRLLRRQKA